MEAGISLRTLQQCLDTRFRPVRDNFGHAARFCSSICQSGWRPETAFPAVNLVFCGSQSASRPKLLSSTSLSAFTGPYTQNLAYATARSRTFTLWYCQGIHMQCKGLTFDFGSLFKCLKPKSGAPSRSKTVEVTLYQVHTNSWAYFHYSCRHPPPLALPGSHLAKSLSYRHHSWTGCFLLSASEVLTFSNTHVSWR